MSARFWQAMDTAAHRLKFPKPLRRWICDRYELAIGAGEQKAEAVSADEKGGGDA